MQDNEYKRSFMGNDKSNQLWSNKYTFLSLKAKFYNLFLKYYIGVLFPITFFLILIWILNKNSGKA